MLLQGAGAALAVARWGLLPTNGQWALFAALQERRPGGFRIAALMRPPDAEAGEDEQRWLARAREAAARGPFGHREY